MQQKASDEIIDGMFDIEAQEAEAAPPEDSTTTTTEPPTTPPEDAATSTDEPVITIEKVEDDESEQTPEPTGDGAATGDVNPEDLSDIVGENGQYMTYREAAKATRELKSMFDKKFEEQKSAIEERDQQVQQWNQWYQQQEQAKQQEAQHQQQVAAATPSSQEELAYSIEVDPMGTFRNALQYTPELVPTIVAHARQTKGDHVADSMMIEHNQYNAAVVAQRQDQMWQENNQRVDAMTQPAEQTKNMETAINAVKEHYGEEFTKLEEDVSTVIGSGNYNIDFSNPASIAGALENAYLRVFRQKSMEAANTAASQPQAVAPQAETGSPGNAPQLDEADQIRQEIMDVRTTPWG